MFLVDVNVHLLLFSLTFHAPAMVTAIDDGIGDIVSALKARNMWENTLLVFSSGTIPKQIPIYEDKGINVYMIRRP